MALNKRLDSFLALDAGVAAAGAAGFGSDGDILMDRDKKPRRDQSPNQEPLKQHHVVPRKRGRRDIGPGKVTLTSKLSAPSPASLQRKPIDTPLSKQSRPVKSASQWINDPWMDAAHRGIMPSEPLVQTELSNKQPKRAALNRVVQRQLEDGQDRVDQTRGPQTDEPIASGSRPGFIDNDNGSNIRNRPAELAGSTPLTAAPLPPATRVFVTGCHPQTDEWWYVTAFLADKIIRGYVQGFRVTTNLPDPTAKLYQVQSGDTAEGLAVKEFASAVRDGHDLRFYENVLLYVNRQHGRAGVRGSYQDPNLFGEGANNVQLEAGRRIWLVSPAYARALEGTVPSGSLSGGAVAKIERFAGHLEDILKSVTDSPRYLGEVAAEYAQAIRDHMVEIVGIVAGFVAAEALSAFLAATPTGVGQIAAVVIQLGLAAFGAAGMAVAGLKALEHASQWLTLAWTAQGDETQIAAASKEFLAMLVSIAMAALAYLGVKGHMGNANAILAASMPSLMPAFAVAGGGQMGGTATGVAIPAVGPAGPVGTSMAMSMSGKDRGSQKGKSFRGGKQSSRDNWYGYNDKQFQRWWHRRGKREWGGNDIEDAEMAAEVFQYWVGLGRPTVK